jgi:hypothetical protein
MGAPGNLEGGCACGKIRYQLTNAPMIVHACHCRDCQRISGAAFAVNLWVERKFVEMGAAEPVAFRVPAGSSGKAHDVFRCPDCGTPVWNKYHAAPGDTVLLCAGSLDDPTVVEPDAHIFTGSKVPWLELPQGARVFDTYYKIADVWPPESMARWRALFAG